MAKPQKTIEKLQQGIFDGALKRLYGEGETRLLRQRQRYMAALQSFAQLWGEERDIALYSTPGRTEIGGNHTDHNNGLVLAAAVDLDIVAVVAKNEEGLIRVHSEGYPTLNEVSLAMLSPQKKEAGRSSALIRGVAASIRQRGGAVGGFDVYMTSDVLKGSGLSSSAAFEVCLGSILNAEYNGGRLPPVDVAIAGQIAENTFFGKPSGLMDQLACAVGGAISIDFENPDKPIVEKIPVDLKAHGYCLVITDTRGSHASLTGDYAAIRHEMEQVAAFFGKPNLRGVGQNQLLANIAVLREKVGDRAILRAIHFFEECRRVGVLRAALQENDYPLFLRTIVEGGHSSFEMNQNAYSLQLPRQQGVPVALALSQLLLEGHGAWRLQGGGFAGAIQAFVPLGLAAEYQKLLEGVFGEGACHSLNIRADGCTTVLTDD